MPDIELSASAQIFLKKCEKEIYEPPYGKTIEHPRTT